MEDLAPSQKLRQKLVQKRELRPLTPFQSRGNTIDDIDIASNEEETSASCNSCSSADEYTPLLRSRQQYNNRSRFLLPEADQNQRLCQSSCSSSSVDIAPQSSEHSKSSQQEPTRNPSPHELPSHSNPPSQLIITSREMRRQWLASLFVTSLVITQRRTQRILALRLYEIGLTLIIRICLMVIVSIAYSTLRDRK